MALTDSFPGPNGITDSIEAGKDLAGLIASNPDGTPRAGILAKGPGALVTGRSDLRVDIAPFKAALVRDGAVRLIANDSVAQSPPFTLPTANSRIDVLYVKVNETLLGDATDGPAFGILEGAAAPIPTRPVLNIPGALELSAVPIAASDTGTSAAPIVNTAPFTAAAGGTWETNGVDSNGWSYRVGVGGKRTYFRFFDSWAGNAFGPAGGTNWSQSRASGILPPTGRTWDDFLVSVNVWPQDTAQNGGQALLAGHVTTSTGTGAMSLIIYNPTALTISNTFMNLRSSITLTEK